MNKKNLTYVTFGRMDLGGLYRCWDLWNLWMILDYSAVTILVIIVYVYTLTCIVEHSRCIVRLLMLLLGILFSLTLSVNSLACFVYHSHCLVSL